MDKPDWAPDWDSPIGPEFDSNAPIVFPEDTEVSFVVTKLEKAHSERLGCPQARITMKCTDSEGRTGFCDESLTLATHCLWRVRAFFRAIGQCKHGEVLNCRWNEVEGMGGRCRLEVEKWTGRDGKTRESNKVKTYLERADGAEEASFG